MPCHTLLASVLLSATLLAASPMQGPTPAAPSSGDATVVFFTPGGFFRGWGDQFKHIVWGKADAASFGTIFDGPERIARFRRARYLVLRMPAGAHTFSATVSRSKPNPKETVSVTLLPGSVTYFAETSTITNYATIWETIASHLKQSSCQEFVEEDAKVTMQPEPEGKIDKKAFNQVDTTFDVRSCKP